MPTSQDEILHTLSELIAKEEGPVPAADIAEELKCPKATVTSLLNKLKTKGMVEGGGVEWMPTAMPTTPDKTEADTKSKPPVTKRRYRPR